MLDSPSSLLLAESAAAGRYALGMTTIIEVRRENLNELVRQAGGKQSEFARMIGKDKNQLNQWLGRAGTRNMSDASARHVETALRLPEGWLDQRHGLSVKESAVPYAINDRTQTLQNELNGVIGVLSILLSRLGTQAPAEGAAVALEIRKFLAKPGYEGEALPELLQALESAVPSFVPVAPASRAVSGK